MGSCHLIYIFWKKILQRRKRRGVEISRVTVCLCACQIIGDAIDVTLDAVLFYQLEVGDLLDINITRNSNVNNAILAFAILESLKMIFWSGLILGPSRNTPRFIG